MRTTPPPADRRKFGDDWDEIRYLYDKLLYWLYQRDDATKAIPYANRLERLLAKADSKHEVILGEECRSLVCEAKGDLLKAIRYRENEIRLIRRLHELSKNEPHAKNMLKGYGYGDLSDRLDILAVLYHMAGDVDKAISVLQESKQLCKAHRIKFDGADILQECLDDKRTSRKQPESVSGTTMLTGPKRLRA